MACQSASCLDLLEGKRPMKGISERSNGCGCSHSRQAFLAGSPFQRARHLLSSLQPPVLVSAADESSKELSCQDKCQRVCDTPLMLSSRLAKLCYSAISMVLATRRSIYLRRHQPATSLSCVCPLQSASH